MSNKEVSRLTFVDPSLNEPFIVNLNNHKGWKWDQLPSGLKKTLDELDVNDDGDIIIDARVSAYDNYQFITDESQVVLKVEVSNRDQSYDKLFRSLWAFKGDAPHDNLEKDQGSRNTRVNTAALIAKTIKENLVPLLLTNDSNPRQNELVARLYQLLADSRDLILLSRDLIEQYDVTKDRRYINLAESILLETVRISSATQDGRTKTLSQAKSYLAKISKRLDQLDAADFKQYKDNPYLLNISGCPFTIAEQDLKQKNEITLKVALPPKYKQKDLLDYFEKNPVYLKPAPFKGISKEQEIPLTAVDITSTSDHNNEVFQHMEAIKIIFNGNHRKTVYVKFKLDDPDQIDPLLQDHKTRKFDLVINQPNKATLRTIPGAVVVQKSGNENINYVVASDLHIAERDYSNRQVLLKSMVDDINKLNADTGGDERAHELEKNKIMARTERFYESINESVEAMVSEWNNDYRAGKIDSVVLTGDIADFINIAATMKEQSYRFTNLRRVVHIISKIEAPTYLIWGNHDPHITPYSLFFRKEYANDDPELYKDFWRLDQAQFGTANPAHLAMLSVKALLPIRCNDDDLSVDCGITVPGHTMKTDPYNYVQEGMRPHYMNYQSNEANLTKIAPDRYFLYVNTRTEDFNLKKFLLEVLPSPLIKNLWRATDRYLGKMAASGIGPDPDTFGFMLRSVEQAQKEKARISLFCHFPVFNGDIGVDGTPNSVDTLKGDVDWAFRLFTWWKNYDINEDGLSGPVVDTVFAGHDHHAGAFSFKIEMESPEREKELRRKLGAIFESARINPKNINNTGLNVYESIEDLVNEFDLKNHKLQIKSRETTEKAIGFMKHFNDDPEAFGKEDGSLFVNVPAAGPPSSSAPPGYLKVSMDHKGHFKSVMPQYIQLEPTGEIFTATGNDYKTIKLEHQRRIREWRLQEHLPIGEEYEKILKESNQRGNEEDDNSFEFGDGDSSKEPVMDYLPLFCQYPKGKFCLSAGISPGFSLPAFDSTIDFTVAQLSIPLSNKYHPLFGFNELLIAAVYSMQTEKWLSETGFNLGILHPSFVTNFEDTHGFTLKAESPIPGLSLFNRTLFNDRNPDGIYIFGFDWTPALLSVKP